MNEELIEICKHEIAHAANYACLKWSRDDLISIHEDGLGDVVFLRRFNPREKIDDDGNVVMRNGKPVMAWSDTMWLEYREDIPHLESVVTDGGKIMGDAHNYTFRYNVPRLVCIAPWLIRIVTDDGHIKGGTAAAKRTAR